MTKPLSSTQLLDYWKVLVRRRWIVYLSVIAVTLLALVGSFLATPQYRSTLTMQIERQNPDILTFRDLSTVDSSWAAYSDFYQTQYKILASPAVARKAVETLGLDGHPMFRPEPTEPGLLSRIRALLPSRGIIVPIDPLDAAAAVLLGTLEVAPVRNSHLVLISWTGPDPQLAADVANTIADAYVEYNIESRFSTSRTAKDFLLNQIETLKGEIRKDEEKLQDYGEKTGILTIDDSSNVTLQAVREVAHRLTETHTARAAAQARFESVRDARPDALPEVLQSPLIGGLRSEYATLEADYTQKARQFKEDWPGMRQLHSRMEQARLRLDIEMAQIAQQVRASAEVDFLEARNEERQLEALLDEQKVAAQGLKRNAIDYASLLSEVDKKRETLDRLIRRQNEVAVAERLLDTDNSETNIRMMDRAKPPTGPFSPNTRLNVLLGLVLGLMLGVGMAQVLDYLDNTVKSVAEIERLTDVPLLAVIQHHGRAVPGLSRVRRRPAAPVDEGFDLVTHFDARARVAEAYRELRTALLLSHPGQPPRRIMVTSAMPQEGKSATTMNLAAVLAQMDRRVLLVDTDLRRPRLHKALGVPNETGVSTYLSGLEADPCRLVRSTRVDNLFILTSGPVPPNPSELLNSPRFVEMERLLLESGFDHILFDSPPVLSVSEPVILARSMDSTILVVRAGQTPRQAMILALERLEKAGRQPTGVVLNDATPEGHGSYYQRYYYSSTADAADDGRKDVGGRQAGGAA